MGQVDSGDPNNGKKSLESKPKPETSLSTVGEWKFQLNMTDDAIIILTQAPLCRVCLPGRKWVCPLQELWH